MAILLVPGFMADETLWRDLEAPLARFAPERLRAMDMRLGGEVFRRQSMLDRPGDIDRQPGRGAGPAGRGQRAMAGRPNIWVQ
jgi:hypothetical protein